MCNIYIVLSQTGTLFSKVIRWYTHDPYNHASISFHRNLDVMYSFGRRTPTNAFDGGFVRENLDKGVFAYFPQAKCCVLEIPVTDAEYEAMYKTVMDFCKNEHDFHYNLIGIFGHMIGKGMALKNHFYCSQFVSYIMSHTASWNISPELTRPMDFYTIANKKIIFEGTVHQRTAYALHPIPQLSYRYKTRPVPPWSNQKAALFSMYSPFFRNSQLY